MTERLHVSVSFTPGCGYISAASPRLPRSLTALTLAGLRRQITVAFLRRWKKADQPVTVTFDLDVAAREELDRRKQAVAVPQRNAIRHNTL